MYPDKKRSWQRNWLKARRDAWFTENGPCVKCGSWDNLELDHKNPRTKVANCVWSWTLKRREKELRKCQALCHICHAEKTTSERRASLFWERRRKVGPEGTAWCRAHQRFLPVSRFAKNGSRWNGFQGQCNDCRKKMPSRKSRKSF